jgi:hypothetical protein
LYAESERGVRANPTGEGRRGEEGKRKKRNFTTLPLLLFYLFPSSELQLPNSYLVADKLNT